MSTLTLRSSQAGAVSEVHKASASGRRSIVLVAPTGAGKTVMGAKIVQDFAAAGRRILWVAHRIELVEQAVARMGIPCGVIVAGARLDPTLFPCTVGSLQTVVRRPVPPTDVLIIDEAHHARSGSYHALIEAVQQQNPAALVVGLTATPCRLDGKGLGDIFETLIQAAKVSELINEGSLVKPRVFGSREQPNLKGVRKVAGEYSEKGLELACNQAKLRGDVVEHWMARCAGRPTVMFAVSIEHSRQLIADFAAAGVSAVHVDGSMTRHEREKALGAVRSGEAKILSNVGIVTEGWDYPQLEVCILARPTASLSLLMQMWGRVMRPWPGKEAIVLDHAGNIQRHNVLPWMDVEWQLEQSKPKIPGGAVKNCPACFATCAGNAPFCPECQHEFKSDRDVGERGVVTVDKQVQLEEITEIAGKVDQWLTKRGLDGDSLFGVRNSMAPYIADLVQRVRANAIPPAFLPYLKEARGVVPAAANRFKRATGDWP
jgi:DNA repair protein RadD